MKNCFNLLLLITLLGGVLFAQYPNEVVVNVFKDAEVRWGPTNNPAPIVQAEDGRAVTRTFLKNDNALPYHLFASGVRIYARVTEWQNMVDDTTLADSHSPRGGSVSMYKAGDEDNSYTFVQFTGALGDSTYFETEITPSIALLNDDVTVRLSLGVWVDVPHFVSLDLVFVPDTEAPSPFWLHPVLSGVGGVQSELGEERWINRNVIVPADVTNKKLYYFAKGTGEDQFNEIENKFWVDDQEVYSFEPWVASCAHTLKFNWMLDQFDVDSAWVSAGRSGACYADAQLASIISSDALENALTPGKHSIRIEPVGATSNDISDLWTAWYISAFAFGDQDATAGSATKVELTGSDDKFLATEKQIPLTISFVNDNGQYIHGTNEELEISAETGAEFSADGENWSNPLTTTVKGATGLVWMRGNTEGEYNVDVDVTSGNLPDPAPAMFKINKNFARTSVASALDSCGAAEAPKFIIDGKLNTKWCSNHQNPPYDIRFGFDTPVDLNYFIVYHAGAGGEGTSMNTGSFEIKVYNTATNAWEVFDAVTDNPGTADGNITYHYNETSVNCDSVMINVITAEASGGTVARIYEFEMYNTSTPYIVSVNDEISVDVPRSFEVYQNYPNPFNPSTEIKFFTPNPSKVRVDVFNILGQHISNLLSGQINPGTHKVRWNGINRAGKKVAGGVYFYTVRFTDENGKDFLISRKMILMP